MVTDSTSSALDAYFNPTPDDGAADPAHLLPDLEADDGFGDPLGDPTAPPTMGVGVITSLRDVPDAGLVALEPYLHECTRIEPMALSEELARGPADFARWNEHYAAATEEFLAAKLAVARVRARRALFLRKNRKWIIADNPGVSVTEGLIADLVTVDPEVIAAEDRLVTAERDRGRVRGILTALGRKAEALVSIGAHLRAEMAWTDPRVNVTPRSSR